jgi:hypothetical protein
MKPVGPTIVSVFAALACSGCNTASESVASAEPPTTRLVVFTMLAHKSRLWKDPDSVRDVQVSSPAWRYLGMGWMVCFRSNARNSFGGYTGLTTSTLLIYDNGAPPLAQEPVIYDGCDGRRYEPAPELEKDFKPVIGPAASKPPAKQN